MQTAIIGDLAKRIKTGKGKNRYDLQDKEKYASIASTMAHINGWTKEEGAKGSGKEKDRKQKIG